MTIFTTLTIPMGCLKLTYNQPQGLEGCSIFLGKDLSKKGQPLKNRVEYHPFGTTAYRAGRSNAEVSLKRYRYVGKERDDETGLYYYGARYYAPWLARFVSTDPLKDDYPQLNPYNYADNNPISDLDIDGQQTLKTQKRFGGVPDKPAIPNLPSNKLEFAQNVRTDLLDNFNNAGDRERNFASQQIDIKYREYVEQARNDLRGQLSKDFFIDNIDGEFKFSFKRAADAFSKGELGNSQDAFKLRDRAFDILGDPQFDSFAFNSQGAKEMEAFRASENAKAAQRDADFQEHLFNREFRRLTTPGALGQFGEAIALAGDAVEITGYFLSETPAGPVAVLVGKVISFGGTGLQIADDFQRLDPETASILSGIRVASFGLGFLGGGQVDDIFEKKIINSIERGIIESSIKVGQKQAENTSNEALLNHKKQEIVGQ